MTALFESAAVRGLVAVLCAVICGHAGAQQPARFAPEISALAPPINHETGTISEVLTAQDSGFQQIGYVVRWRDSQVFVTGSLAAPQRVGENIDFMVYRSVAGSRKILRFAVNEPQSDASGDREEAESSHASVTSGGAPIEDTLIAENDGYRFVAYQVRWHGMRVMVVDPLQKSVYKIGDTINFRVLRSGAGEERLLAFALSD